MFVQTAYEGIKKAEVSAERTSVKEVAYSAHPATISISRLFEKINPSDESFYKYIPEQFKGNKKTDSSRRTVAQEIETLKKQKKAASKKLGRAAGALTTSALFMANSYMKKSPHPRGFFHSNTVSTIRGQQVGEYLQRSMCRTLSVSIK